MSEPTDHTRKNAASPDAQPHHLTPAEMATMIKRLNIQYYVTDASVDPRNPDHASPLASVIDDKTHDPASLTKLMNFYVTCQALQQNAVALTDTITIEKSDMRYKDAHHKKPDGCVVRPGQTLDLDTALKLMMVSSDNAAANAIARHVNEGMKKGDQSYDVIKRMNSAAIAVGMRNTRFVNSDGYYPDKSGLLNLTTAPDMNALMYRIYNDFPKQAKAYLEQSDVTYRKQTYPAHYMMKSTASKLSAELTGYEIGGKTGYLGHAGHNLVMRTVYPDKHATITVVMGSHTGTVALARTLGVPETEIERELDHEYRAQHPHHRPKSKHIHDSDELRGSLIRDMIAFNGIGYWKENWHKAVVQNNTRHTPATPLLPEMPQITAPADGTAHAHHYFELMKKLSVTDQHALKEVHDGNSIHHAPAKPKPAKER